MDGLVTRVRGSFPGLETQEALEEHRTTVHQFTEKQQAICVKEDNRLVGVMLFSCCRTGIPAAWCGLDADGRSIGP